MFTVLGARVEDVSLKDGIVMKKKTVNQGRMKTAVWRKSLVHVDLMNFHVLQEPAFW